MQCRCSAGVDAGVSDGCDGGHVVDHVVFTGVSFGEQAFEASFAEFIVIEVEIVPAHLVDDESDDEFGSLDLCLEVECDGAGGDEDEEFVFHC